jgi:hypothetical protein
MKMPDNLKQLDGLNVTIVWNGNTGNVPVLLLNLSKRSGIAVVAQPICSASILNPNIKFFKLKKKKNIQNFTKSNTKEI